MALKQGPLNAPINKDAVAKLLADSHRSVEPAITGVFRIEAPGLEDKPEEPIKLLEVNNNTTPRAMSLLQRRYPSLFGSVSSSPREAT